MSCFPRSKSSSPGVGKVNDACQVQYLKVTGWICCFFKGFATNTICKKTCLHPSKMPWNSGVWIAIVFKWSVNKPSFIQNLQLLCKIHWSCKPIRDHWFRWFLDTFPLVLWGIGTWFKRWTPEWFSYWLGVFPILRAKTMYSNIYIYTRISLYTYIYYIYI